MEKYLDISKEQFMEFLQFPMEGRLQMLNLLKFKIKVEETGLTGEAQYRQYMKEALPFFQKSNANILFLGSAKISFIGPADEWDKVLIVEYQKKEDFVNMITAEGYPAHLRKMSLEDSRLIYCKSTGEDQV